jgi:hypothetical protein
LGLIQDDTGFDTSASAYTVNNGGKTRKVQMITSDSLVSLKFCEISVAKGFYNVELQNTQKHPKFLALFDLSPVIIHRVLLNTLTRVTKHTMMSYKTHKNPVPCFSSSVFKGCIDQDYEDVTVFKAQLQIIKNPQLMQVSNLIKRN